MKKALLTLSMFITIFTFLIGCASQGTGGRGGTTKIYYPADSGSEQAHTKLAEAAIASSSSLARLAAIEKATHPKAKLPPPMSYDHMVKIGLGALTSIDWTGPIEPVVKELALISRYKFRVIGKRPAIPAIVAIYAVNMPVGDILRDINYQAGNKADVVTFPNRRLIELRYRPTFIADHAPPRYWK